MKRESARRPATARRSLHSPAFNPRASARTRALSGPTHSLPVCQAGPGANSQLLTTTAFTLTLRGLHGSSLAPAFAPRRPPCKAGGRASPPPLGPKSTGIQPHSRSAGRAASTRGAVRHHVRIPPLNSPGPPTATFGGPAGTLAGPLLTLSGSDESQAPPLPMAAAPGEASSRHAADGEGSPRAKTSPLFDILDAGKGWKGSAHKGCWDMSLYAPPTAVTWSGVCSARPFRQRDVL